MRGRRLNYILCWLNLYLQLHSDALVTVLVGCVFLGMGVGMGLGNVEMG